MLGAYDQLFGLELDHLAVDGCITKAPCGREVAGPNPVDRRKQGLQRSILTDADGLPLGAVPAAANCRDDLEKQLGHEIFCAPSWRIWISRYALSLER